LELFEAVVVIIIIMVKRDHHHHEDEPEASADAGAADAEKEASADAGASAGTKKQKQASSSASSSAEKDDNGDAFWALPGNGKRRVTVSEFKGNTLISIREYYEKDGKELPGKKGISLTVDQWKGLTALAPDVDAAIAALGN
jgi:hypothetical protein